MVIENCVILLPKKYEDRLSFLEEFNDFGFEIIKEHFDSFTHYSTEMQTSLANKLKKIIDIKSNNLTKDYIFNENFDSCIKRYNNNITTYIDHNEPDLKDNKMFNYYKNTFDYKSPNDVINRTIGNGFQHGRFGPLTIKNDRYVFRTAFLNGFYALGAGVSFSRGKGLFIDGSQSSTTFKFWEIPLDAGLGVELPFGPWISLRAIGGGTIVGLYQSRDDYASDEKGKKRVQYGYGPFAEGNVRFNLSRLFPETAFEYFSQSEMTNISINASMRYQNYSRFKDDITISGTSFGLGFGFEFL